MGTVMDTGPFIPPAIGRPLPALTPGLARVLRVDPAGVPLWFLSAGVDEGEGTG